MMQFNFRGHIAPVFTPFNDDENQSINLSVISHYARYLLENGVKGLLVNGTTGEGMSMSVQERKQVTEEWVNICKETKQTLMVQIGGAPLPDAQHAEKLQVDALLCLPELYFKPKNEEDLINYLKLISDAAPNTPLLYYHIPAFTNVHINMAQFLKKADGQIKTLVGIKFTSTDLVEGAECVKVCDEKYAVFLGADQILSAAYTLGFDSAIATTFNIFHKFGQDILLALKENKTDMNVAVKSQATLTACINEIIKHGGWVPTMKTTMNIFTPVNVGPVRQPLQQLASDQKQQIKLDLMKYIKK